MVQMYLNYLNISFLLLCADFQPSIDAFQHLEKLDPFRINNIDIYSNVLFVKVRI